VSEASGVLAWVSIGTNLGDRAAALVLAVRALDTTPGTRVVALSPVFETAPVGPPPQGPYLNAVVALATSLGARALLERLLAIEREAGRSRAGARWAARTLDLDLLLHGADVVAEPGLVVPHPRIAERAFVLEPFAALAPRLPHPTAGATIGALAQRVRDPHAAWRWVGDDPGWRRRNGLPPAPDTGLPGDPLPG
jgi:2-amino-4-hydroxy-6-hydroxymethyldihydropteridine diphosphokinase